jgi:hypothetical protein
MTSTIFNHIKNILKMKSNSLEIILFSERNSQQNVLVEWLANTVQPVIVKQEVGTKKVFLKTMKDTPAIYMS